MSDPTFRCWCCGQVTLTEEPNGSHEICGTCGWEDDRVQLADPTRAGGANGPSLREARRLLFEGLAQEAFWSAGNVHGLPSVTVHIPDRAPAGVDEGADWLGDRIANGGNVAWRVSADGTTVRIWMKHWEQGEPEPDFPKEAAP